MGVIHRAGFDLHYLAVGTTVSKLYLCERVERHVITLQQSRRYTLSCILKQVRLQLSAPLSAFQISCKVKEYSPPQVASFCVVLHDFKLMLSCLGHHQRSLSVMTPAGTQCWKRRLRSSPAGAEGSLPTGCGQWESG